MLLCKALRIQQFRDRMESGYWSVLDITEKNMRQWILTICSVLYSLAQCYRIGKSIHKANVMLWSCDTGRIFRKYFRLYHVQAVLQYFCRILFRINLKYVNIGIFNVHKNVLPFRKFGFCSCIFCVVIFSVYIVLKWVHLLH